MKSLFAVILLAGAQAMATGGDHGAGDHSIPGTVKYQALNLAIFAAILIYFARGTIKQTFQKRYDDFTRLARETEQTRKNLEFQIADIIRRTNTLEQTSQKSLAGAQADAEKVYLSRLEDAKQAAARMETEVVTQINDDQKKVIEKLRAEALEMSVASAEQQLQSASSDEKSKVTRQFGPRVEGATV